MLVQQSEPLYPTSTAHNVEWVVWVGENDEEGALVVEPEEGSRVRWESVTRQSFDDLAEDSFDVPLRKAYGVEVEQEGCMADSTPSIIAPPLHSFEKHVLYLPRETKEQLLSFYESWGENVDRYYQHEASIQVALNHVDEIGEHALKAPDSPEEQRYAIRVEPGTWDGLQTALLETELEYPQLDSAPRRQQYYGLVQTAVNHEDEVKALAHALSEAEEA